MNICIIFPPVRRPLEKMFCCDLYNLQHELCKVCKMKNILNRLFFAYIDTLDTYLFFPIESLFICSRRQSIEF